MTKKSKELSEEDKVTTVPKKGTRGKKVAVESLPASEDADSPTSVQEVAEAAVEAVVTSEVAPVQEESTPDLEAIPLEGEEQVAEEEEQVAIDLSGLSKLQLFNLLQEKVSQGVAIKLD